MLSVLLTATGATGATGAMGAVGPAGQDASAWLTGLLTVLGAAIAGVVGLMTAMYVERRRDKIRSQDRAREEHAAARLICSDLHQAERAVAVSIKQETYQIYGEAPNKAWRTYGLILAPRLDADAFDLVFLGFVQIDDLWRYAPQLLGQSAKPEDNEKDLMAPLQKVLDAIRGALDVAHPIAYPDAYHDNGKAKTASELRAEGGTSHSLEGH